MARLPATLASGPVASPRQTYSFSEFTRLAPMAPIPGDRLDTELHELRASLTAAVDVINGLLSGTIPLPTSTVTIDIPGVIGTQVVDIHTGHVDGGQRVLPALRPVLDVTPRAQQLLNEATGAANKAEEIRTQIQGKYASADAAIERAHVSADQAERARDEARGLVQMASTILESQVAGIVLTSNDDNHASLASFDANQAQQLSWKWAEYLSGPVLTEAEYAAIDPDLIPPGYTYNPVTGMGTAGLWSSKWWAVRAQQFVGDAEDWAGAAGGSAAAAADSAQDAADAAAAAEAIAEDVGDLYLGAHPTAPIVDNDGETLLEGALYFNSATDQLFVWDGDSWNAVTTPSGSGVSASAVTVAPVGTISSTNAQAAFAELSAEKLDDAPNDGGTYGRHNAAWVSVVSPTIDWGSITGKPATFPPSAHTHAIADVTGLQAELDNRATDAELGTEASARAAADSTLTTNLATEITNRTNADTALQGQITANTAAIATKIGDAPSDGKQYARKDAAWSQVVGGATVGITFPGSPIPGQLHWDSDSAQFFLYYDDGNTTQWVQLNYVPPSPDLSLYLAKSGGTMTGGLVLNADPDTALKAATKQYVDAQLAKLAILASTPNMLYNGDFSLSQAAAFAAVTTGGQYYADGWRTGMVPANVSISAGAGTTSLVQKGRYRTKVVVNTAKASLSAGDLINVMHPIEGVDMVPLRWGTANGIPAVLRFGVRAPAGTYSIAFQNDVPDMLWAGSFTIAAGEANTDVIRVISIPPPPTSTWLAGSQFSGLVRWTLACGATGIGPAGWSTGAKQAVSGQFNILSSTLNEFYLFDVKLVGDPDGLGVDPGFTAPEYEAELTRCRRYYIDSFTVTQGGYAPNASASQYITFPQVPIMRANPTITVKAAGTLTNCATAVMGVLGFGQFYHQMTSTATGQVTVGGRQYTLDSNML